MVKAMPEHMAARLDWRFKGVNKKMLLKFDPKKAGFRCRLVAICVSQKDADFPAKTCFAAVRVRLLTTWRIND
jgi:hypothetical protein